MTNKIKIRIAVVAILMLALSSCGKEWLDAKVDQQQAVPMTIDDFRAMLNDANLFNQNSTSSISEIAADYHIYTEATWNTIKGYYFANAYTWSNNIPYESIPHWNQPYNAILSLNIILEGLSRLDNESTNQINALKGEALFYRGKIFFELSQNYAPPLTEETSQQNLGIPLRLSSDINVPTTRSTVRETYAQIIKDLSEALTILPNTTNDITKPTKLSALGLLARVSLSMESYTTALSYANEYLNVKNILIDYNSKTPGEVIGINAELSYLSLHITSSAFNPYLVDSSLYNKYEDNDLRKRLYFQTTSNLHRFIGSYSNSPFGIFCGVATDEIYLIRAECLARQNDLTAAMNDLNHLLRHRYLKINETTTYIDKTAINKDEALGIILLEREKELILRNVRWSDLRRLNKDPKYAKTISRNIGGMTYKLEPNSFKYTFPIPDDIMIKTSIAQNPGWE
jgi:hypothetical protein